MRWRWLLVLSVVAACEEAGQPEALPLLDAGTTAPAVPATASTTSTPNSVAVPSGVLLTPVVDAGAPVQTAALTTGLPCAVETVLKEKCQTCHGQPLMSGPMPLITRADLLAASTLSAGAKMADRMKTRIRDQAKPMPPSSRPALSAQELKTLEDYLAAGTPETHEACKAAAPSESPGKLGDWQPPDSDCEIMMEMRAHGGQTPDDVTPYEAPTGGDHYEVFYFKPTWSQKMHVIRMDPVIDNGAVLHHWLLYMEDGNGTGIGTHKADSGLQSAESQLLSGWAPGNKSLPLGKEVGMQVIQGANARFAMEVHYNTDANPPNRNDRSGVRLCLTSKLRPKEAGTHWLGTQAIVNLLPLGGNYDAVGTCTTSAESHIIAYSPHLHRNGRAQKSIVRHADGSSETLNDGPFDFNDQRIFPVTNAAGEVVVRPGDVVTTTCSYDASNVFTFGSGTSDEMCYNFVVAWPVGSLSNGAPGLVGGKNTCIDGI
jgi:cytochrome c5